MLVAFGSYFPNEISFGCTTSRYVFNIHPDKIFVSRFHVMCIHELPQNIEQKQDNYVSNFLQKPLSETSHLLMEANDQCIKTA